MKRRWRHRLALVATVVAATTIASTTAATAGPPRSGTADPTAPLALPVNACHNDQLPRDYGTNFPVPSDPSGYGFQNQTVIGWEGNYYAPFAYLSGSYFARGVPTTYTARRQSYCGAMYSFGAYNYGLAPGQAPAPGSVSWTMADGYLPAMTTSFTRNDVAIAITDFADRQVIGGYPVELVYTRVRVRNEGSAAVSVPAGQSGPGLVALNSTPDTVAPGRTAEHDFVAAVDTFGGDSALPTTSQLAAHARRYGSAYAHMRGYWNQRLSSIPRLSLPNVSLPNTNGLSDPGTAIDNAYKAAFVYTRIVQVGAAPFSAADNYDWLLNHDVPGLLLNRFALGDFTDAHDLLLTGRISEQPGFDEKGANWYWDGLWKTPSAWAEYLAKTNDVGFVAKYFHDDANGASPYGPSLYTIMHTDYLSQLGPSGYLRTSGDNDSSGTWLFDDESALLGLASYRYIASRIGNTAEATWADQQYTSLLAATNEALAANEQANDFDYLPCEVNQPASADRCGNPTDANWNGSNMWNQNVWDIYAAGGALNGVLGDPSQTDNLYQFGFARLAGVLPYPTFGAFTGFSTAYNTSYTEASLYGNAYRDLPITSYAWQIATTTGGPNAWWEANGSAPDPNNPWAGSHAGPQFGAVPYAWPMAGQTDTLLETLAAERRVAGTDRHGNVEYHTALDVGRGVPDAWIAPGQNIAVDNITSSANVGHGDGHGGRDTYGVHISTRAAGHGDRVVHVVVTGQPPSGDIDVALPALADSAVKWVRGGHYDPATHTVQVSHRSVQIELGAPTHTDVSVSAGTGTKPVLTGGQPTTVSATIANTGETTLHDVQLTPDLPRGWTATATSPTSFAAVQPGAKQTATWSVTPASDANGGFGLRIDASYVADGVHGSSSGMEYVQAQRPLPVPPGATDLALGATPSASYTSPWEHVSAINDGIYPPSSNDSQNFRWGTWPMQGTQWIELDWTKPITTNGSSLYFFADGGGVFAPASWKIQYWNGTSFVDVPDASSFPTALNTFNPVTFGQITTTRLRAVLQSGQGSVGALEWLVYDAPSS